MEIFRSYEEGHDYYFQNHISFEYLLELALFYTTRHLCTSTTSTTQSYFFQADVDLSSWPDLDEGAHNNGDSSEQALFSFTQHPCTSTSATVQSRLSQDELATRLEGHIVSFSAALEEGDHLKGGKDLKQELDRDDGEKKREWRLSNGPEERPLLTFEQVARYFCMPVKQAAKELNVGLTHLKRRCRELGIPRWPHRKVKSLETLIKNVQELGSNTGEQGRMTKIVLEMLQQAKKLIEETPGDIELDQEMKVLRQVCFKENYKRRRLMAIEG